MRAQSVEIERRAGAELDVGGGALAEDPVGHADRRGEGDARMERDAFFDRGGREILAAADDDVVGAADDAQVALGVELDEIAEPHPAVGA